MKSAKAGLHPTLGYVAPFAVFIAVMAAERSLLPDSQLLYPVRFVLVLSAILLFSRPYIDLRPTRALASIGIGIGVFLVWIAPDHLFHYRHFWLFENSLTGKAASSIAPDLKAASWFLLIRAVGSVALVPIAEELFWRGWLMRWWINSDFQRVPLGTYAPGAFWLVALLFASEHGPYWEVGLAAGVIYNWWLIRTRSLADCILAHAVTNAILAVWVLATGEWQYWL
jgi:CAAX prenyl protease-like protein